MVIGSSSNNTRGLPTSADPARLYAASRFGERRQRVQNCPLPQHFINTALPAATDIMMIEPFLYARHFIEVFRRDRSSPDGKSHDSA